MHCAGLNGKRSFNLAMCSYCLDLGHCPVDMHVVRTASKLLHENLGLVLALVALTVQRVQSQRDAVRLKDKKNELTKGCKHAFGQLTQERGTSVPTYFFYQHMSIALYKVSVKRKEAKSASYRDTFYTRQ